ncbi:hypothetical protein LOY67_09025 [Pseudomonas sp. B21-056]|jgi:hypothetical protein|uniref:hypothetical protein n=1 Tax=Pseudomonas sp. B21-056 TaxID=2895495 RepID=UPI0022321C58|nr:hypothetical protein [Pseudomonas sp. B21-056]UZE25526.1 hypothetical protein LOY67_09025 [Pseudomonas sp. B21-056]
MNTQTLFIPKDKTPTLKENVFTWNLSGNPIVANKAFFYLHVFPPTGEKSWAFSGSTGALEEENLFIFGFSVPYISEDVFDNSYTLDGGLHFYHGHSIPAPEGFWGYQVVTADSAELSVRLDPVKRTASGDFAAVFRTDGYRLDPRGTFNLRMDDQN